LHNHTVLDDPWTGCVPVGVVAEPDVPLVPRVELVLDPLSAEAEPQAAAARAAARSSPAS
jgi:hypothetical protein